jgi:DNA segregation ATPase FtsK/SpoIIIE, S-DNA-T family
VIGKLILLALALAVALWLGPKLVRFILADWQTRRSMWQAWRIRRGWVRLSRMQGLTVTDPTPTLMSRLRGRRGAEASRILVPRLRIRADSYGVVVHAKTLPRVGRDEWVRAAPHLANAWGCVRVAVAQDRPGRLRVRAVRRDPLTEPAQHFPTGLPPAELDRWVIGRDEYAEPVEVRLSNVPGVCVAGLPGYGKTSSINGLVVDFAPSPAVQFAVVDGKGGADYEDLAGRFFAFADDNLDLAHSVFERLYELRRRRSACIRVALGTKNLWHVGPSSSWPLVLLVIDEAHTFLSESKGDKDRDKLVFEKRRLVEDLVKKGRSVGICVVLATQKSTGDAIPTAIRDVCPVALSFAQRTDEAAVAALGADIRQYPDANPVSLQDPAYVGVASMVVQGRPGFVRVRAPYVRDEDVHRICQSTSGLTRDPAALFGDGPRLALYSSDGEAMEPRSGAPDRSGEAAEADGAMTGEVVP